MGWEIHNAKETFPKVADDWDRLNAKLYGSHPFYDSRFIGPLLTHFADGKELLCVHRSRSETDGALILRPGSMGRWVSFRPSQTQATAILLDDARLVESLFKMLPGFPWTIELHAVDPRYSPDMSHLVLPQTAHPQAHTVGIDAQVSFAAYWEHRSKNLRANVRRYLNRARNESKEPVLTKITDPSAMDEGLARYGQLESEGWKSQEGTAISRANLQGKFYKELLEAFASSGQAAVYELYLAGELAASRLVISNDQMIVILKTTYDEKLARYSPGWILLHLLIEDHMRNSPSKIIEFYTNASPEQKEWSTFDCTIQNFQIFRNEYVAAAFQGLKAVRRILRTPGHRRPTSDKNASASACKSCESVDKLCDGQYDLSQFGARDNIEASIEWFDLLHRHVYAEDCGVRYYFAVGEEGISTILPLRLKTTGRVRTVESLSNYYTSLYTPLLSHGADTSDLRHLLAGATRDQLGAHVMRFAPMDTAAPAFKALVNGLRGIGWIPFTFFCFGNWYLEGTANWESYLKTRSANQRSSIKRRSREFIAAGGTLEVETTSDQIEHTIDAFQEVYSASWKKPEPYPFFIPALIRLLASNGMLRLGIAKLNGKPIAAQLWIVGEGKASIYKVAYHEEFSSLSPGTVLTSHLIRYVIENDHVKEIDFLIGDDNYKRIWMSHRRERWGIIAYNPRTLVGLALFAKEMTWRFAKACGGKVLLKVFKPKIPAGSVLKSPTNRNSLAVAPKADTDMP